MTKFQVPCYFIDADRGQINYIVSDIIRSIKNWHPKKCPLAISTLKSEPSSPYKLTMLMARTGKCHCLCKHNVIFVLLLSLQFRYIPVRVLLFTETPSEPCGCPSGFSRCAGRCLKLLDDAADFESGMAACTALGAHLAVPRSEEENRCVLDMAEATGRYRRVLIGANDRDMEGVYVGVDGDCGPVPVFETWWNDGEPNNFSGDEDCVMVVQGRWYDIGCPEMPSSPKHPLCQLSGCYQPQCQQ